MDKKNSGFKEDVDRSFVSLGANYTISDKLTFNYLYSLDLVNELNINFENKGGVVNPLGFFGTFNDIDRTTTHRFSLNSSSFVLNKDTNFNFVFGSEIKSLVRDDFGVTSTDQVVFNFLNHNNFRNAIPFDSRNVTTNTSGVYAKLDLDYKDYLFFSLAGKMIGGQLCQKKIDPYFIRVFLYVHTY